MKISFKVDTKPQAKERPRFSKRSGTVYTPNKTGGFEDYVIMCFQDDHRDVFFEGAITAQMDFFLKIPASLKNKEERANRASGKIPHTIKPDLDNLIKSICDALNKVAYHDDSAINKMILTKQYSAGDPYVIITLEGQVEGE